MNYTVSQRYLEKLPSPFSALSLTEKDSRWGEEYLIGIDFAKNLDLYRAITAFRRSQILAMPGHSDRRRELEYDILLAYYLGKRYEEIEQNFPRSGLTKVSTNFPVFHDLLIILFDSYQKTEEWQQATQILSLIEQHYPETYKKLLLSSALTNANFPLIEQYDTSEYPYIGELLCSYNSQKKSSTTAAMLNAVIPGTGYMYLGQYQTGVTALLLNGLFIAASVHFFRKGPIAAGIITASFEAGWYFGGIYGGAAEANFYNERLYERCATPMMNREGLFPIFQLQYSF